MKKILTLFIAIVATTSLWAHNSQSEESLTLHVETPGTLEDLIFDAGTRPALVAKLTLTGTLNDDDFTCMREKMTLLIDVNLLGITNTFGVNFNGKNNLVRVILPANLTSIGYNAFANCTSLASITIPNSVTSIRMNAFGSCESLASITIPNSVTSIGDYAFSGCSLLKSMVIPDGVRSIGNGAFHFCSSLTSITIPNSVTSIGESTFRHCSSLTSINIPNSVTSIGFEVFFDCSSLASITIPNSVTSIGESVFCYCSSLTSITIPESVTSIGDYAFGDCESLSSITCLGTTPPNASNIGVATRTCILTIPHSAQNAYLRHSYWGQFINIITGYLVTLQANNDQWGEVAGAGFYTQEATIRATAYEGYTFTQWSDGNTDNPRTIQLISDTTLIAEFDVDTRCLVTFIDWDGTVLSSVKVTRGEAAIPPADPYREGYTFIGWDKDFSTVTDHMTITAQYRINRYCVRFLDYDNTLLKTDSVVYQSAATAPADPYREGYTFIGWDKDFSVVTDHMTITALYKINRYCVRFLDYDGTLLKTDSVVYQSAATAPADPYREGYTFIGWDKDFSVVTDHMTITALYKINRYCVRFLDYDGTLLKTDSVVYQSAATAPADPYREGYTFIGWDKDFNSITADLDIYAQYEFGEERDMTIVFTNSEDNDSEVFSQTISINIPTPPEIKGFTFLKWHIVEGDLTDVITIQAIYEADIQSSTLEEYVNPANPAQKLLRNGQVYILKDDKTYTILGTKIQ